MICALLPVATCRIHRLCLTVSFVGYVDDVLAIWRNRGEHDAARARQLFHAHVLEWNRAGVAPPLHEAVVQTVKSSADHQHAGRENDEGSALAPALLRFEEELRIRPSVLECAARRGGRSGGSHNSAARTVAGTVTLQPLQIGAHLGGTLIAEVAILLQRLVDDLFQLVRDRGIQFGRRVGAHDQGCPER